MESKGADEGTVLANFNAMWDSMDTLSARTAMKRLGLKGDSLLDGRVQPFHQEFAKVGRSGWSGGQGR